MIRFSALTLSLLLCVTSPVLAQSAPMETRLRDQLRQTVVQLRDLQNNQAALAAAKAAAENERDALKAKLAGQPKNVPKASTDSGTAAQLAELRTRNSALQERLEAERAVLTTANNEMTKAKELIQILQSEKAQLMQAAATNIAPLTDANAAVEACLVKNQKLVEISNEILTAYENIGVGKVIRAREPFIQSKRVQIENVAQAFGDKIYKSKFNAAQDRAAPSAPLTTDVPSPQ